MFLRFVTVAHAPVLMMAFWLMVPAAPNGPATPTFAVEMWLPVLSLVLIAVTVRPTMFVRMVFAAWAYRVPVPACWPRNRKHNPVTIKSTPTDREVITLIPCTVTWTTKVAAGPISTLTTIVFC